MRPAGFAVASASADGSEATLDGASGAQERRFRAHDGAARCCAYASGGSGVLVTGSDDRSARVWDAVSGECLAVLLGHTGAVDAVALAPGGSTLATGGADGAVLLWDAAPPATPEPAAARAARWPAALALLHRAATAALAFPSDSAEHAAALAARDEAALLLPAALAPGCACAVCAEPCVPGASGDARPVAFPCAHAFHAGCVVPWLLEQGDALAACPLCRRTASAGRAQPQCCLEVRRDAA